VLKVLKVSGSTSEQKSAHAQGKMPAVTHGKTKSVEGKRQRGEGEAEGEGEGKAGQAVKVEKAHEVKALAVGPLEASSMLFSDEVGSGVRGGEEITISANPPPLASSLVVFAPEKGQGQGSVAATEKENTSDVEVTNSTVGLLTAQSDSSEGVHSSIRDQEIAPVHSADPPSGPLAAEEPASTGELVALVRPMQGLNRMSLSTADCARNRIASSVPSAPSANLLSAPFTTLAAEERATKTDASSTADRACDGIAPIRPARSAHYTNLSGPSTTPTAKEPASTSELIVLVQLIQRLK
jgi:hypothetical protein